MMNLSIDPTGVQTLAVIHQLHQQGVRNYAVLMRHADRPIDNAGNDLAMRISDLGKRTAYEFGRALPCDGVKRFYSSPIHRCVQTAELIAQGCLARGGDVLPNTPRDDLFAFFVRDVARADGLLYEALGAGEPFSFFRNWFDGVYPPDIIDDAAQAARAQMNVLLGLLQQDPPAANICVSHDINLFLIKQYYLDLRPEDHEYIQFLEGVVVYEWRSAYYIVNHQAAARRLAI